ncbi:uncharacterized protein JCM6883_005324 [Sporobolomyces salmoneus]|uniref:uncharacterized protein n=1 Tax=Sporobolomyces salmoneus TaxID=183962 RepID=UPI0031764BDA
MSVQLSPSSQLGFQRPLTTLVKRTLSVSNHNQQAIAYKVKTTAPKQYCVRPNSGRIEPGETVEVQVLLQPMKEDPPAGTKCRDKFLVQSVIITPERENIPLTELWGVVEKDKDSTNRIDQIHEQKIRCTYLPAADEPVNQSIPEEQQPSASTISKGDTTLNPDSSFVSTINSTSPSSNSPSTSSPAQLRSSSPPLTSTSSLPPPTGFPSLGQPTTSTSTSSPTQSQSRDIPSSSTLNSSPSSPQTTTSSYVDQAKEKASSAATIATASLASAATVAASGLTNVAHQIDPNSNSNSTSGTDSSEVERLKRELSSARTEISSLKSELSYSGLRNRGTGVVSSGKEEVTRDGSSKVVEMRGAEGVPVQTVAAIAFAVFLFTWMFL